MNKTEYPDTTREIETAYTEGFRAGKQAAIDHIFTNIDRLHLHVANEYEARAYEELKKKYGVK